MTSNSFYGTYFGNAGALAQSNPNSLTDRGVYGAPNQGQPYMNTPARLPLAQGFAGGIGNMAGMEGAQLRYTVPPGFQNKMVS